MVWNAKKSFVVGTATEELFPGGKYAMIITAGIRAHDLQRGAKPLIAGLESHKPSVVALMEIEQGLISPSYPHDHIEPSTNEGKEEETYD